MLGLKLKHRLKLKNHLNNLDDFFLWLYKKYITLYIFLFDNAKNYIIHYKSKSINVSFKT